MTYRLAINTGFAVNRFSQPEQWVKIVGDDLGVRFVQFTADLLNPSLPDAVIAKYINRIKDQCAYYNVEVTNTFTGAFTRVNHLAHPDKEIRNYWVEWFKRYVDMTVEMGGSSMGSHFGIFTAEDSDDPVKRKERYHQNIEGWHEIAKYACAKGLQFLTWEPMSIKREQGETLDACENLQRDVNVNSPLPFKICLDVDHGDVSSANPDDTDPYAWLKRFAKLSPIIHLKQSSENKGGHWPFTKEHNKNGRIIPDKVLAVLENEGVEDVDLTLELSFREREPVDSNVIPVLQESVLYWRSKVKH